MNDNLKLFHVAYKLNTFVLAVDEADATFVFIDNFNDIVDDQIPNSNIKVSLASFAPNDEFYMEFPYHNSHIKNGETNEWWLARNLEIIAREKELVEKQALLKFE